MATAAEVGDLRPILLKTIANLILSSSFRRSSLRRYFGWHAYVMREPGTVGQPPDPDLTETFPVRHTRLLRTEQPAARGAPSMYLCGVVCCYRALSTSCRARWHGLSEKEVRAEEAQCERLRKNTTDVPHYRQRWRHFHCRHSTVIGNSAR